MRSGAHKRCAAAAQMCVGRTVQSLAAGGRVADGATEGLAMPAIDAIQERLEAIRAFTGRPGGSPDTGCQRGAPQPAAERSIRNTG